MCYDPNDTPFGYNEEEEAKFLERAERISRRYGNYPENLEPPTQFVRIRPLEANMDFNDDNAEYSAAFKKALEKKLEELSKAGLKAFAAPADPSTSTEDDPATLPDPARPEIKETDLIGRMRWKLAMQALRVFAPFLTDDNVLSIVLQEPEKLGERIAKFKDERPDPKSFEPTDFAALSEGAYTIYQISVSTTQAGYAAMTKHLREFGVKAREANQGYLDFGFSTSVVTDRAPLYFTPDEEGTLAPGHVIVTGFIKRGH